MVEQLDTQQSAFLQAVETRIVDALEAEVRAAIDDDTSLSNAAKHLALAPGAKRARPRLVLAFGRAVSADLEHLVHIAASAELIHTASLLHDDVVDRADERRGRASANDLWGNAAAVLTGDVVLSAAITMLATLPREVTTTAVLTVAEMSRSAWLEVRLRGQASTTAENWLRIASGKTGALFSWCARSAATVAGDAQAAQAFADCAMHLGIAFQLIDDTLDFQRVGTGKPTHADLRQRGANRVVIEACAQNRELPQALGELWSNNSTEQELSDFAKAVTGTKAVEVVQQLAAQRVAAGFEALGPCHSGELSATLQSWAASLTAKLTRRYAA